MADFNTAAEVAKAAPPVAVTSMTLFGCALPDVIQVCTLAYLAIQIVIATPKLILTLRGKYGRRGSKRE